MSGSKTIREPNRHVKAVKAAERGNPWVDLDLLREFHAAQKVLSELPPPEPEPVRPRKKRLQPIPLRMFS